jgi:predicted O-methyltransferase YrrM
MTQETGVALRWLLRHLRALKKHRWASSLWRRLRGISLLQKLLAGLRAGAGEPRPFLLPVADATLPPDTRFLAARAAAHRIDGMFTDFSMAVVDSLLSLQAESGIGGGLLEFGVYKGRSAALLCRHLGENERLVLVDITDYLERGAVAPFRKSVDLVITPTETFQSAFADYDRLRHGVRFIHIDASHDYRATINELTMADELLAPRGIIALDDFTNLNYSQNIAAVFRYLHTAPTDLVVALVTNEKAYLCRKDAFAFYADFILQRLIGEMGARQIDDCVLARTDVDPDYRAIYARHRAPGETGHHYGVEVESYRNNFRAP